MSFAIYTDAASNLPGEQIRKHNIRVLPCTYTLDGVQYVYNGDIDSFDAPAHYNTLRAGHLIQTSLLNTQLFLDHFRPALEEGLDIGDEKPTLPAKAERAENENELYLTITEGRFHQVKRMLLAVDNEVVYLKRLSMGPLKLEDSLEKGCFRELTDSEKKELGI